MEFFLIFFPSFFPYLERKEKTTQRWTIGLEMLAHELTGIKFHGKLKKKKKENENGDLGKRETLDNYAETMPIRRNNIN